MRPLVIVPTYNERENLPLLTQMLLGIAPVRLMIVDDRSSDGTGDIADTLATPVRRSRESGSQDGPRGLGRSYIDGMQAAIALDADPIVQMDADLSHDPTDVPRLIAASAGAGLVVGSRYIAGGQVVNWPIRRVLLSRFANWYVRKLTQLHVHDCTSGFRCWRRSVLERMPLRANRSEGYSFQVEMTWEARRLGCVIVEVPITFSERREGASKLSSRVVLESAILPWRLALRRHVP
jgi:dolichol-phosphate mannosyltransferase